ncbi:MAG: 3-carboxy-cis,cis-muconate cycloisomerase [Chloroflexi bacterium]|nr:3-carboxy-cis,cis-muconate cycloisomerase [Chloroflexota bacterium]
MPGLQPFLPLTATFGDPETAAIWSEGAAIEAWCAVEVALAEVQAGLGDIPVAGADLIREWADPRRVDRDALRDGMRTVGYPILPLLVQLRDGAPPAVTASLHWGATTQDIMDTALAMILARSLDRLDVLVVELGDGLASLAATHRSTVMAGRTHDQLAVPTTLGAKLAVFLVELARGRERILRGRSGVAVVSLFGAGGTAAALGPRSVAVRAGVAARLGLADADVPWHVARDGLAEAAFACATVAATAGRLAREVIALSRSEVDELREVGGHHRGASSTMPQKANPISSETTVGFSMIAAAQVPVMLAAMQPRHERAAGEWQAEWDALPVVSTAAAGAVANALEVARGIRVDPARMAANLGLDGGMIMAEAAMMALAPIVGRGPAHDLVYVACSLAREEGRTLIDALQATLDPGLVSRLPPMGDLLAPSAYLGEAVAIADRGVAAWRDRSVRAAGLSTSPEAMSVRRGTG